MFVELTVETDKATLRSDDQKEYKKQKKYLRKELGFQVEKESIGLEYLLFGKQIFKATFWR